MNDRLTLRVERHPDGLGPEWDPLFQAAADLQSSRAWLAATIAAALPQGAEPHLLAFMDASGPLALVPMLAGPGRAWGSLTTPYTCIYQPLFRADATVADQTIRELGRYCRQWPLTRFDALDPQSPGAGLLRRSLASAGLVNRSFSHFGNWHEPIGAGGWEAYLQARPGALRETIRRRSRAASRLGARVEIARAESELTVALDAYEAVYRRSWKQPEPFPAFNAALVSALAGTGVLRIGVMWSGDTPIAAQYWSVVDRKATVLKLAHDSEFKSLSPGTVLTAATIRALIEIDGVRELDFGRGDDAYKRDWVNHRRPRIGLMSFNRRTVRGVRDMAIHDAGAAWRSARSKYEVWRNRPLKAGRAET